MFGLEVDDGVYRRITRVEADWRGKDGFAFGLTKVTEGVVLWMDLYNKETNEEIEIDLTLDQARTIWKSIRNYG